MLTVDEIMSIKSHERGIRQAKAEDLGDSSNDLLSFENATHKLMCRHVIGPNGRTYYMRCHVLKTMSDGRLKLLVHGDRYWRERRDVMRVRYVEPHRVFKR